jgi:hypothetical protein
MFSDQLAGLLAELPRSETEVSLFAEPVERPAGEKRHGFKEAPPPRAAAQAAPVFQLEPLPVTLTPANYSNPASNSNPGGSYTTLAAFQQLADPVPGFSRYYSPSPTSTEGLYGNIINGADVPGNSPFTQQVIASAQRVFQQYGLANLGASPGVWHPVYASPYDWYDVTKSNRFQRITMDMSSGGPSLTGFTTLPGSSDGEALNWRIGDNPATAQKTALDPGTKVNQISFLALRVDLARPWLLYELFQTRGWYLSGQPAGIISSGQTDQNNGMMPLIATGLIVGYNLAVTAQWQGRDQQVLQQLQTSPLRIALGPFALSGGAGAARPTIGSQGTVQTNLLQVIGWISDVVPFAPSVAGP